MEEGIQYEEENSVPEGMPKVYKYLIIGIIIAVVLIAGLAITKVLSVKQTSELKDYGSDFEGFVSQAKSCEPSKVLYNASVDLLGMRTDTYTYEMKIKGVGDGACSFYMEIVNYTTNPPQEGLPSIEFFKSLNKTCNIPLDMIETEFEYWNSGSPKAFSNRSYCVYAEQVTMGDDGQLTGTLGDNSDDSSSCAENWTCSDWSSCSSGTQTRTCTDSNNCRTTTNKPATTQTCTSTPQDSTCTDSDGGKDYSVKGRVKGPSWFDNQALDIFDECVVGNMLDEYYCQDGKVYVEEYNCPNGCSNGACLSEGECEQNSDCSLNCESCVENSGVCIDFGGHSGSSPVWGDYNYQDYETYFVCRDCFDDGDCKSGYECSFYSCEPTFETECLSETCENCVSGQNKFSSEGGFSACYECDTADDCIGDLVCYMGDCYQCATDDDCSEGETCSMGECVVI